MSMPGAFPLGPVGSSRAESQSAQRYTPSTNDYVEANVESVVDSQNLATFSRKQQGFTKSRGQLLILQHLDGLVYFLSMLQFIKFCHSACLIPLIAHVSTQRILTPEVLVHPNSGLGLVSLIDALTRQQETSRDVVSVHVLRRTCQIIYIKLLALGFYHTLFVLTWVLLIANDGDLPKIETGTWWFVSFIGESTPAFDPHAHLAYKLWQLGLPGLLFINLLITFVQLVQFQSQYKQSTLLPGGIRLSEEEVCIVRGLGSDTAADIPHTNGVPMVLQVNLYETFTEAAYLNTD